MPTCLYHWHQILRKYNLFRRVIESAEPETACVHRNTFKRETENWCHNRDEERAFCLQVCVCEREIAKGLNITGTLCFVSTERSMNEWMNARLHNTSIQRPIAKRTDFCIKSIESFKLIVILIAYLYCFLSSSHLILGGEQNKTESMRWDYRRMHFEGVMPRGVFQHHW